MHRRPRRLASDAAPLLPLRLLLLSELLQGGNISGLGPTQRQHEGSLGVQDAGVVLHIALQVWQHVGDVGEEGIVHYASCQQAEGHCASASTQLQARKARPGPAGGFLVCELLLRI